MPKLLIDNFNCFHHFLFCGCNQFDSERVTVDVERRTNISFVQFDLEVKIITGRMCESSEQFSKENICYQSNKPISFQENEDRSFPPRNSCPKNSNE